jgi:NAD(P)-dependent dehydrogenase (short-subunit alcohol dehydrogenase family)
MKTFVITGATGAIGKAAAIELARSGNNLILVGRDKEKLDAVVKEISSITKNQTTNLVLADLADIASIKKAAEKIKSKITSLDGLIHVAAAYKSKRELTKDGLEYMFAVNHMAAFVLTHELLTLINSTPGSRVLTVSAPSTTALKFEDLQGSQKFSALTAFGATKMANHLFTYALSRRMHGIGTAAMIFHPGLVKSDLIREMALPLRLLFNLLSKKPEKPGHAIAKLITGSHFNDVNGKFFNSTFKELQPPGNSSVTGLQEKLWNVSEEILQSKSQKTAIFA